jgi:hypothetical protein
MAELHVTDADLPTPGPLDAMTRPLGAPELLASADEARALRSVSGA